MCSYKWKVMKFFIAFLLPYPQFFAYFKFLQVDTYLKQG